MHRILQLGKNKKQNKKSLIDTENRWVVTQRVKGWEKWFKGVEKLKKKIPNVAKAVFPRQTQYTGGWKDS